MFAFYSSHQQNQVTDEFHRRMQKLEAEFQEMNSVIIVARKKNLDASLEQINRLKLDVLFQPACLLPRLIRLVARSSPPPHYSFYQGNF